MIGRRCGSVIFQNASHAVAPSMAAASYILRSIFCSPARNTMICTPQNQRMRTKLFKNVNKIRAQP